MSFFLASSNHHLFLVGIGPRHGNNSSLELELPLGSEWETKETGKKKKKRIKSGSSLASKSLLATTWQHSALPRESSTMPRDIIDNVDDARQDSRLCNAMPRRGDRWHFCHHRNVLRLGPSTFTSLMPSGIKRSHSTQLSVLSGSSDNRKVIFIYVPPLVGDSGGYGDRLFCIGASRMDGSFVPDTWKWRGEGKLVTICLSGLRSRIIFG